MLERLQDYLYSKPGRIRFLGKCIFWMGAIPLLVGAYGHLATVGVNILPTLAKQPQSEKTLADIYPDFPVWWVPESWLGVVVSLVIVVVGVCVAMHGKDIDRIHESF